MLARRVTGSEAGAIVAGLLFAFAPYLPRAQLQPIGGALDRDDALLHLGALRVGEHATLGRALTLGGLLALTYYNSVEYALYLILFSLLWLLWTLGREGFRISSARRKRLLIAGTFFTLLALPLLHQQLLVARAESTSVGDKLSDAAQWSAALGSFVTPSRAHPLYGELWRFASEFEDGRTLGMRSETAIRGRACSYVLSP